MRRKCQLSVTSKLNKLKGKPQCHLLTRNIYSIFKLDLLAGMVCFSGHCGGSELRFEGILTWLGESYFTQMVIIWR